MEYAGRQARSASQTKLSIHNEIRTNTVGKHMKTHLLTLIGVLILMVSCKQKETPKTKTENKINETVVAEQYIENDSLLTLLKSDLYNIAFNPIFDGEEIPKTNSNNKAIAQINKTLIFEQTKIHFYREGFSEEIISAKIKNSRFKFLDSICIGTKIKKLENQIETELKTNLIKIGNLEQTSVFVFKFENEILNTIDYEGYLD